MDEKSLRDMIESIHSVNNAVEASKLGLAKVMYNRLMIQIKDFEETLKPDEEIGAYLASFGREIIVQIQSVGYHNPYFIIFYGINTENGQEVKLVQHTSQINVLFVAVKLKDLSQKPRRIGFNIQQEDENIT
jgi:hypothetical protein